MRRRKKHYCPPWVDERIAELKERKKLYKEREAKMLSDAAKQYSIGSRSLTRHDTPLSTVIDELKKIDTELADLEAMKSGRSARRAFGVMPRDDW